VEPRKAGHAVVVFDDQRFGEDLQRPGSEIALAARRAYEQEGVPISALRACDEEGRDSTKLPGCLKVYVPQPSGKYGIVFTIERQAGKVVLAYLAFGIRHQPRGSNAPTVYQVAHQRLHS
jgi:hypothetical protein